MLQMLFKVLYYYMKTHWCPLLTLEVHLVCARKIYWYFCANNFHNWYNVYCEDFARSAQKFEGILRYPHERLHAGSATDSAWICRYGGQAPWLEASNSKPRQMQWVVERIRTRNIRRTKRADKIGFILKNIPYLNKKVEIFLLVLKNLFYLKASKEIWWATASSSGITFLVLIKALRRSNIYYKMCLLLRWG